MHTLRFILCDVFTDRALSGNQLAVFTDARKLTPATMQALARETNLSESVFVLPAEQGGHARIRIFTPTRELPFAGHPTLGAAFVLGGPMQSNALRLETGAGIIPISLEREGPRIVFGWMVQPVPRFETFAASQQLLAALGVRESRLPIERYDLGPSHVYVALETPEQVAALTPDMAALARVGDVGNNVFARTASGWKTRMFAPNHGVNEDPATGSAAGPLAVHLLRHGWIRAGEEIQIEQGAEVGRPSRLYARVYGGAERIERVEVGGAAVIVGRGEFRVGNVE
ncbi:MAG TPA: PhzF family phenazine biosynthesis protein [Polyangiales bacterium]|nr:PhzF family phenazine biosynthesis protein [Polyangiales bacterium]